MYGPPPVMSPVPPAGRVSAARIGLWVLVAVALVGGVGFFAFIPLTVLAVRSRTLRDVLLTVASFGFSVVGITVSQGQHDTAHEPAWFVLLAFGMLAHGIAATVWFIVSDLRHQRARQRWPGALPGGRFLPPAPSGGSTPPPGAFPFAPLPQQPDRLGRVRAELDELSDYLRKEQDR